MGLYGPMDRAMTNDLFSLLKRHHGFSSIAILKIQVLMQRPAARIWATTSRNSPPAPPVERLEKRKTFFGTVATVLGYIRGVFWVYQPHLHHSSFGSSHLKLRALCLHQFTKHTTWRLISERPRAPRSLWIAGVFQLLQNRKTKTCWGRIGRFPHIVYSV